MGTTRAFWSRNVKKYLRSKSRIPSSLGQPLFFLIFLGFGLGSIIIIPGGGSYLKFIVPGVVSLAIMSISSFYGIQIVWDKQFGFLKETLIAPTSRFQIMLGQTLGGATAGFIQGIIMLLICCLVTFNFPSIGIIIALLFMFMIGVFFAALGIAIGSRMEDMQSFGPVVTLLLMPLFGLSGGLFPLNNTFVILRDIAYFNPLSYAIEGIRYGLYGTSQINPLFSFFMLLIFCVVMIVIGSLIFNKMKAQTN